MSLFTEEDLAGLSEAEREALRDLAEDDQDLQAPAEAPGLAAAAGAEAEAADGADVADALALAGEAAVPDAGGLAEERMAPVLEPVSPADAHEQRLALRAEKAAALQLLLDGELDQQTYQQVEARVQDQLDDLARAAAVDMARMQLQQDAMVQEYGQHLGAAQRALQVAGIDLEGEAGAHFDRAIRLFAQEAADRGLSDALGQMAASREALAEAQALVLRRFGKPQPAPVAAAEPARAAERMRRPALADRSGLPPTLAGVPAAADAAVGHEFAHLESLEGSALERALARMTPDQQERYLGA